MPEPAPAVWKKTATLAQVEGVRAGVESHVVWSNMSATVTEGVCITPSTLTDHVDCSRLVMMLVQEGARVEIGPHRSRRPTPTHDTVHQTSFGPPGAQQWGFFRQPSGRLRWLVLQFDLSSFAAQLGDESSGAELCPRYMFFDPFVVHFGKLIETECSAGRPASALYFDTLALGLVQRLAQLETGKGAARPCYLSPRQRCLVFDYMRTRLADNIRLAELAAVVDLSPAHFCRAFKASVGLPPHLWQLRERIRVAQVLLLHGAMSLAELAISTGFADQAHFTRVFRRIAGATPHAWRRRHRH